MTREISGYVGQIVSPADHASRTIDPVDAIVADGQHIIGLNESPIPSTLDSIIQTATGGRLGFSIELSDCDSLVLVDEVDASRYEVGEEVSIHVTKPNVWQSDVYEIDEEIEADP